jgi:CarD family transcriptional regulator
MFQVNDVVVYGLQGVCEIVGIDGQKVNGVIKNYFVLKPKNDKGATFYIPTWIENENERKETYKKILANGDQAAIISMIQALFIHKKEREDEGKQSSLLHSLGGHIPMPTQQ